MRGKFRAGAEQRRLPEGEGQVRKNHGSEEEPLSQATVVEGILSHIVKNKEQLIIDRDWARRGRSFARVTPEEARKLVLRPYFVAAGTVDVSELLWNYFDAVKAVFPDDWKVGGVGNILPRTNGFRALMRFFRDAYNDVGVPGEMVTTEAFEAIFRRVESLKGKFTTENYPAGTSGEARLYNDFRMAVS